MRQLTATQKIAHLEHRIATLEKQAMFNKIKSLFSKLRPLKQASSALRDFDMRPKDILLKQKKVSKTKMYKELEKSLRGKSHEQKIETLSGILANRDNIEVLESRYGFKYSSSGKQASLYLLGLYSPQDFLILLGVCAASILIWACSAFLMDIIEKLIYKVDKKLIGKGLVSHFAGSWVKLLLNILYYPLKGIHKLAEAIASLIADAI